VRETQAAKWQSADEIGARRVVLRCGRCGRSLYLGYVRAGRAVLGPLGGRYKGITLLDDRTIAELGRIVHIDARRLAWKCPRARCAVGISSLEEVVEHCIAAAEAGERSVRLAPLA
jgi:hypothetical protein